MLRQKSKLSILILSAVVLLASCNLYVPNNDYDYCYEWDFSVLTLIDFEAAGFSLNNGYYILGAGIVVDENFNLNVTYTSPTLVEATGVQATVYQLDPSAPAISLAIVGEAFGINITQSGEIPAGFTTFVAGQNATVVGSAGYDLNLSVSSSASIYIKDFSVYGHGPNPFGVDNCGDTIPTPSPAPTITATNFPTMIPSETIPPTPTGSLTATFTPSPTSTYQCWVSWDMSYGGISIFNQDAAHGEPDPVIVGDYVEDGGRYLFSGDYYMNAGWFWTSNEDYPYLYDARMEVKYLRGGGNVLNTYLGVRDFGGSPTVLVGKNATHAYDTWEYVDYDIPTPIAISASNYDWFGYAAGQGTTADIDPTAYVQIRNVEVFVDCPNVTPTPTPTITNTPTKTPQSTWTPNPSASALPPTFTPSRTLVPVTIPPLPTSTPLTSGTPNATQTAQVGTWIAETQTAAQATNDTFATAYWETGTALAATGTGAPTVTGEFSTGQPGGDGNVGQNDGGVIGIGGNVFPAASNIFVSILGWVRNMIDPVSNLLQSWQTTAPQAPPGIPLCKTDPYSHEVCAIYYIMRYSLFSGTVGSLIIPLCTVLVNVWTILRFVRLVRAIIARATRVTDV